MRFYQIKKNHSKLKPIVMGGQNLPHLVGIGLTDLQNIGRGPLPPQFQHHCLHTAPGKEVKPVSLKGQILRKKTFYVQHV